MPKAILVVEDDEDFQALYKEILLSELDVEILQAFNGEEGLKVLETRVPDLIILDILMPVMDGEEFFHILREVKKMREIPVIIASVNDRAGESLMKINHIPAVFKKPFPYHLFLQTVKKVLGF
ncbi:MAG: response regulator [Candidatus Omnitrophica bacterium]|nr:response regulator [Candidatus Omnitrophota bacterium]